SHKNLARTAVNARELFNITPGDTAVSYLPLSHIAEQLLTVHGPPTSGYAIYFAQFPPQDHLVSNLQEAQPTLIFGVPRIWEKFQTGVAATLSQATGAKAKLVNWAQNVGSQVTELRNRGEEPSGLLAMQHKLANKLVFSKVKAGLGLSRARIMLTAAAPISPEILHFFGSLDLNVMEVYGQSEGTGLTTANIPGANKVGTVGQAWPETKVKIADDGEIVLKGPNVFLGYFKDPEATAADLQDGWLHSGDLGEMDEDGYVKIIGRKKEIIITSGGKNIAPKNIEAALKDIDIIAQAVVIGERRRYITALLTLDEEHAVQFAREHGLEGKTLHDNAVVIDYVQMQIDEKVNPLFARVEQVRKFTILPRDFTVEDGELTPTLKIKRRVVNEHFAEDIEAMYEE
ncbi:MAG TPA: long-chain fatty acid--CoA ligase, partial [Anaerolineae bacterium]|nr:long-chain fatty acid--CoA ligase [Anaerolineae bacterium]